MVPNIPPHHSLQTGCCLHLTQESYFQLFYKQSGMRHHMWRRPSIRMAYSEHFLLPLCSRTERKRMILDPASPFHTFKVSQRWWLGFCWTLMFKYTWSPLGYLGSKEPHFWWWQVECRSIVVTVMSAMLVKQGGHSRPICQSTAWEGGRLLLLL